MEPTPGIRLIGRIYRGVSYLFHALPGLMMESCTKILTFEAVDEIISHADHSKEMSFSVLLHIVLFVCSILQNEIFLSFSRKLTLAKSHYGSCFGYFWV